MSSNRRARALRASLDCGAVALLAVVYLLCFSTPAQAYVDPSVVTYAIQALAGVAVAVSAVLGVVWRRLRRRIYTALNIDENRDKVRDPEVHEVDPDTLEGKGKLMEADEAARFDEGQVGSRRPQNVRWAPRLALALLVWGCLIYTVGVVGPIETVVTSLDTFLFGLGPMFWSILWFALGLIILGGLALSCVRGKAFNVVMAMLAALSVCCFVEVAFLNTGLPVADGHPVVWDDHIQAMVLSSVVWIVIIGGAVIWAVLKGKSAKTAAAVLSVILVIVQSVGLGATWSDQQQALDHAASGATIWEGSPRVTNIGRDEVSAKGNVVMFVLDTFDNSFMDQMLERYPDALDGFTGFTRYANTSGVMIPTRFAMSSLVTGQYLDGDDASFGSAKIASWYKDDNLVDAMGDLGYGVNVYATDMPQGATALEGRVGNIQRVSFETPFWSTVGQLWKCSLYRQLPWAAKPPFWFYSGDVVNKILTDSGTAMDNFVLDDAAYLDDLEASGLKVGDAVEGENGTYRLIHLMGSHYPMTLDADGERVAEGQTDVIDQSRGALKAVETYLDELRRLGIYDQTTVIITADHGDWYLADEIHGPASPILLVKPAEDAQQAAEPLKVSEAPVSQRDLPATLLKAMGDPNYGQWGRAVDEIGEDEQRTRLYDATSVIDGHVYTTIKEWAIDGDVQDWSAWSKTGKEWSIDQ